MSFRITRELGRKIFEEIMIKNVSKFHENYTKHIIIKSLKKQQVKESQPRGRMIHYIRGNKQKTLWIPCLQKMYSRRQWNDIFKVLRRKKMSMIILYMLKISLKNNRK